MVLSQWNSESVTSEIDQGRRTFLKQSLTSLVTAGVGASVPNILRAQQQTLIDKISEFSWYSDLRSSVRGSNLEWSITKNVRVLLANYVISHWYSGALVDYDDSPEDQDKLLEILNSSQVVDILSNVTAEQIMQAYLNPEEIVTPQVEETGDISEDSVSNEQWNFIEGNLGLVWLGLLSATTAYFALNSAFLRMKVNKLNKVIKENKESATTKKIHAQTWTIPKGMDRADLERQLSESLATISSLEADIETLNRSLWIQQNQGNLQDIKDRLVQMQTDLSSAENEKEQAEKQLQDYLSTEQQRHEELVYARDNALSQLEAYEQQVWLMEWGAEFIAEFTDFAVRSRHMFEKFEQDWMPFGKGVMLTEKQCQDLLWDSKQLFREVWNSIPEESHDTWLTIPYDWIEDAERHMSNWNIREAYKTLVSAYAVLQYIKELNSWWSESWDYEENVDDSWNLDFYRNQFDGILLKDEAILTELWEEVWNIGDIVDIFELFKIDFETESWEMASSCKKKYREYMKKYHTDGKQLSEEEEKLYTACLVIINACKDIYENEEAFSQYMQVLPLFYPDRYWQI